MFNKLINLIARFFGIQTKPRRYRYDLKEFESRSDAIAAASNPGVAALVGGGKGYKWLIMQCPCGCNEELALNLMHSHKPFWRVEMRAGSQFSVHPSVDSTTCGAHFWIRDGEVIWC